MQINISQRGQSGKDDHVLLSSALHILIHYPVLLSVTVENLGVLFRQVLCKFAKVSEPGDAIVSLDHLPGNKEFQMFFRQKQSCSS